MCVCIFYKLQKLSQSKEEDIHTSLHWASEVSPTLGCSIEISRVIYIYIYVGLYVYSMPKCVGGITRPKQAWTKNNNKRSLRNEKFKANRASEIEEQRKERLRIRREKWRTKKLFQKTTRNSTWPLSKD